MGQGIGKRKKWWIGGLAAVLLLSGAGVAWMQRTSLLAWYYVQRLAAANDNDREGWVEQLVALDEPAVAEVLGCLRRDDARACANVQAALVRFAENWGAGHPRRTVLLGQFVDVFPQLSGLGQQSVLEVAADLMQPGPAQQPPSAEILKAGSRLLTTAARPANREVRVRALELATVLLAQTQPPELVNACRELAQATLQDEDPENRLRTVRLAMRPEIKLLEQVTPLLNDPVARVRQAAILAVGPARDAVRDDELLRSLHDPDADVRRLCEATLRSRGLNEEQLRCGRLLTDARPTVRLQVLDGLCRTPDLEPGVWLRHLSHDPEPAVRAAAVRAAAEQTLVDLTDRLEQMARDDPSDTVRQMARHYLSCRKAAGRAAARP